MAIITAEQGSDVVDVGLLVWALNLGLHLLHKALNFRRCQALALAAVPKQKQAIERQQGG